MPVTITRPALSAAVELRLAPIRQHLGVVRKARAAVLPSDPQACHVMPSGIAIPCSARPSDGDLNGRQVLARSWG